MIDKYFVLTASIPAAKSKYKYIEKQKGEEAVMIKYHICPIDLEKEENWINNYIRHGWRLKRISFFKYEFIPKKSDIPLQAGEIEPDEDAFLVRCDARSFKTKADFQEYIIFLLDAGWRHIKGDWREDFHYFERISPNASEELFSDDASKSARYIRQAKIALTSFLITLPCLCAYFMADPFHIQDLFNMKAQYLTPGLWEMEGFEFWSALLFETPFALLRSGALQLLMLLLALLLPVLLLYYIAKAYTLSRKAK